MLVVPVMFMLIFGSVLFLFRAGIEFSKVAEELLHNGCFVAVRGRFISLVGDVHAATINLTYGFQQAVFGEGYLKNTFFFYLWIKNAAFFCFLADIVPDVGIERGLGSRRSKRAEYVGAGALPWFYLFQLVVFQHVAALGDRGATG